MTHANAHEALQRVATNNNEEIANCMNAKQEADRQTAQAAFAEMQQREPLKEKATNRLLAVLKTTEEALGRKECERVVDIAHAYNNGVRTLSGSQ